MQAAAAIREPAIRLDEPVRSLLRQKGHAVWSVTPDATVLDAVQHMSEKHVGCLLVLAGGHLTGIVTERDYARKVILQGRNSQLTRVRDIMSMPVLFVREDDSLEHAMELMTTRRIRHLPVMRNDDLVGVVSIGDMVRWILEAQGKTIRQLQGYIDGNYPG
jgi:CBS domain-containing protein